jgi:uncharacterized protein (TIGR02099 family)
MLHLFKSAASRVVTLGLIGLLVAGALIGALRLALPFADLLRSQLEGALSETLGLPVRVGHMGVRLAGLVPRLTLEDAELLDPGSSRPQLRLKRLQIDLNLAATLWDVAPKIDSVTLVGAQLVVKRLQDGRIALSGLEGLKGDDDPEALTFFFGNGRFQLEDSDLRWIDEQTGAPALQLADVSVLFENADQRHRLAVLARLFDDPQTRLRLVGDLEGGPGRPADWHGEIYLHWEGGSLEPVLDGRLPTGLHLGSDSVDLESWSRLEGKLITESLDRIAVDGLRIWSKSGKESVAPLQLDRLEGLLRWRQLGDGRRDGWQLQVKDLALARGGSRHPVTDMGLRVAPGSDGGWGVEGGADSLDLSDAADLLAQLALLLPKSPRLLGDFRPRGELHDLRFRVLRRPQDPLYWAVSGRIADLHLDVHGNFPGIRGLTADVAGNDREGSLFLSSRDLVLDLPLLFPNPLELDEATGEVRWRHDAQGSLQVSAREIVADNADVATRSRFSISLPADGGSPFLDLQTDFRDVPAASVRGFIPSRILKEKLARWLDRAFVSGRVPSGTLLFRGAIADFPFDEQQGHFEVLFGIDDGILDFHKDWPRLEEIVGEARFRNREMEIRVSGAKFLRSEIVNAAAHIPNLKHAVAIEIQGRAEGPFGDDLRVLGETPLRKKLGALAHTFVAEGVSRLDLDMAIPLRSKGGKAPLRVTGALSWPGPAALAIPDQDIELTDLAGTLRFTERTLESESIAASLWDVPVRLHVDTIEPQGDAAALTRVRADGRFPASVLARQFPSPSWKSLKGWAQLELRLDVGNADMGESVPPIDFELTSDLAGLAVELPAPLGKPAAGSRRLRLSGRLAPKEALRIQGHYGDLGIDLGLSRGGENKLHLTRGSFNLGGSAPPLPKDEGLLLRGSAAVLDLKSWRDWWESSGLSGGGDSGGSIALRSADLNIGRLLWTDTVLEDVRLKLSRRSDRWEASIRARELAGKISIPHHLRREPVRVALEWVDLKRLLREEGEEGRTRADGRHEDPRQAHAFDLSVKRLMWGENPLGSVSLRSEAVPDGLAFTDVALTGPLMSIQGRGSWRATGVGPRSSLSLAANGSDLGEFLRRLEFKSLIYKAPAKIVLDLGWPGGPVEPSATDLTGRIQLQVGAGSLLEVEPGVGRVLGILNLEALQRRLTLDFSDLFEPGYAFEKISGEVEIGGGEAVIEALVIEGPSADVSISGSANLVDRELNQIVTVTPRIGTGVAIASAVAGGPLVGAAVFLADKVSGGIVDKLGRHQYLLSGPWTEPKIRRGRLGTDGEQDLAEGHFLESSGRAGAEDPQEPKSGEPDGKTPAEKQTGGQMREAPSLQGDGKKSLFLEGY